MPSYEPCLCGDPECERCFPGAGRKYAQRMRRRLARIHRLDVESGIQRVALGHAPTAQESKAMATEITRLRRALCRYRIAPRDGTRCAEHGGRKKP